MLKESLREPAMSDWARPVMWAPKKNSGQVRSYVDYRSLNALTVGDTYLLPRVKECTEMLGEEAIPTTIDCSGGYWQTEIPKADRGKTIFSSHHGFFRIIHVPLGLKNALALFSRAVEVILAKEKWPLTLVYLDDTILYSKPVT